MENDSHLTSSLVSGLCFFAILQRSLVVPFALDSSSPVCVDQKIFDRLLIQAHNVDQSFDPL
jgi:hypothetical protein